MIEGPPQALVFVGCFVTTTVTTTTPQPQQPPILYMIVHDNLLGCVVDVDWLRGGRRTAATSGVQRSSEVMPTQPGPRLVKQGSKDSDGSVSSEGSK
jgi:hypothetical protein